ncbi:MAG: hypothetical protein RLY97_1303, partial [Pseudomonadota bacterium]
MAYSDSDSFGGVTRLSRWQNLTANLRGGNKTLWFFG